MAGGAAFAAPVSRVLPGENPADRTDIEILFDDLPEPIDLELDLENRMLYWTDRGDPPRGNTVNRTGIDAAPGKAGPPEIVLTNLMEGIGIALDLDGSRMFITDFAGSIYSARLDGSDRDSPSPRRRATSPASLTPKLPNGEMT